jgi:hypothetical protein
MATNFKYDGAASVRGVVIRVTPLNEMGQPDADPDTNPCGSYYSTGFIRFAFTPEYTDGDEIEIKNASGEVCVSYKMPDVLKQITFTLEICDPDPILTEMLVGGQVISDSATGEVLGYASTLTGEEARPNGVGIEVWANAVIGGKAAGKNPYWHYVFPYAKMKFDGERVIEAGNLATVFSGRGVGNPDWKAGPQIADADHADFSFPEPDVLADRPYAYMRVGHAPVGENGCQPLTPPAAAPAGG